MNVTQSMSKAGYPYDNVPMERYFNTLKNDLIYNHSYKTESELYTAILEILDFFCMHSPCRQGSFSPLTLEKIGWNNQWNSKKFRDKVSELLGLTDENFKVTKYQHDFKEIWSASGIIDDYSRMRYPFAYLAEAGETNDFMNPFHRIRNSFAHGRYKIIRDNGEYYIYFEDVKQYNGHIYVLGRMCLTKTGLDNLRKFLMLEDPSSTSFKSLLLDDS